MRFEPSAEQALVACTARAFAQDVLLPRAAARDRAHTFPEEEMRRMAELGLVGLTVPPSEGGVGMGALAQAEVVAALAEADASVAVTLAVTNMVAESLAREGDAHVKARFLRPLCAGGLVAGAFALSEAGAGSDPAGMRTLCRKHGGGYRLDGSKQWITSGDRAGVFVVMARHEGPPGERPRFSAFVLPAGTPGLSVGPPENKLGQRGSTTVPLTLEAVDLPAHARLGAEGDGFRIAMAALDGGRINVAAMAVGVSRAALGAALAYAQQREQFGKPLSAFQAIQVSLADAATQLEAAWLMVARAAWAKDAGLPCTQAAAEAKLFASEAAQRICDCALQVHGGYGYTREFPVERFVRDARVMTIYEGTSQIQKLVVARHVLQALRETQHV